MPRSSPIWGRDGGLTGRRDGGSGDSPTERSERVSEDVARIHDGDVIDESFDELMGMLDHPVFVVTTQADGHPAGCLVSFATQTSVQPPSFMVGLPRSTGTSEVASRSEHLAVHVLSQRQHVLAELFGSQTEEEVNKFARCSWRAGPCGMPILDDAAAWFIGRTASRSDVGDYVAYLLEPVSVWAPECSEDLLYLSDLDFDVDDIDPGKEASPRFYERERGDETRRYGVVRFTLDALTGSGLVVVVAREAATLREQREHHIVELLGVAGGLVDGGSPDVAVRRHP